MLRILHFADAHIDMASQGRHDPATGLPLRVLDFLKALDTIVDTAINERVDLVLFAGDAYKDRAPSPTFQREWGRRIMRLSQAGVPVLMLVGNHDLSPAVGRAHALQEFDTLQVPNVRVVAKPSLLTPDELWGLPLQVLALPWVTRSAIMASLNLEAGDIEKVNTALEERLGELVHNWLETGLDPNLPAVLAAHASVQGAVYGGERSVMLGGDMVLPGSLVRDPRLDYVALGHIHKAQDLNPDASPPVIYPGSIERGDWGEAGDEKRFVIASLEKGEKTKVDWRQLDGRRFIDRALTLTSPENFQQTVLEALPPAEEMQDAILRLTLVYPREFETLLDEPALRQAVESAFEFHLVRRPQFKARLILGDRTVSSLTPSDLLGVYWETVKADAAEASEMQKMADEIFASPDGE